MAPAQSSDVHFTCLQPAEEGDELLIEQYRRAVSAAVRSGRSLPVTVPGPPFPPFPGAGHGPLVSAQPPTLLVSAVGVIQALAATLLLWQAAQGGGAGAT